MPTNNQPLVSVILAYYNGAEYVEEAIKSVLNQTYKNIELIVIDDCSPDDEERQYIKNLAKKYSFVLLANDRNLGANKSVAKAFEKTKGDYISLLAQDDLYLPDRIEYLLHLIQDDNLDAAYCNGAYFHDDASNKYKIFDDSEVIIAQKKGQKAVEDIICSKDTVGCLLIQGGMFSRRVFAETISLRDKFAIDDWPLTIKVWRDYCVKYDSKLVYLYRLHENNVHKNYWKWLPGRFHVIAELVPTQSRWNTAANILSDVGAAVYERESKMQGIRVLAASLFLAENEAVKDTVRHTLLQSLKKLSKNELKDVVRELDMLRQSFSLYGYLKFKTAKFLINLVPLKKWRKKLKKRFLS